MKTKKSKKTPPEEGTSFDAVKSMREIKDKISQEIADMNFEQLRIYFKQEPLHKSK